jgi:predicted small metal-binding protein
MAKLINCECGQVIRADSDDELVRMVESHISARHPDLVGKLAREDILGMAEVPS